MRERYGVFRIDGQVGMTIASKRTHRLSHPKTRKLLERIILAASNENDIVLDPFVGSGTTTAVADKLKRQWIGIDQSVQAIKVSELRLQKQQGFKAQVMIDKEGRQTQKFKNGEYSIAVKVVDNEGLENLEVIGLQVNGGK